MDFRQLQHIGFILGPVAAIAVLLAPTPNGLDPLAWRTAAMAILMAIWWASEALPVAATALIPLVLLPILGITDIRGAAAPYSNPLIYLFLGGFLIALAVERWSLHRRLALYFLARVGTGPRALLGGFMAVTAFLSMWVSNTATTIMMLPVALAVIPLISDNKSESTGVFHGFPLVIMLGIAYSASIGGLATLVGTPPNALLAGFLEQTYNIELGFAKWMLLGVPTSIIMLALAWLLLAHRIPHQADRGEAVALLIAEEIQKLGAMSVPEKRVAAIFVMTALLWVFRPVLAGALGLPQLSDTGIAIFGALMMFMTPAGTGKRDFLLNWDWAKRAPWDILILFGGGLSLANAINTTGLAAWLGGGLSALGAFPAIVIVMGVVGLVIFLTELTSNTATTAAFLPVVAAIAVQIGLPPLQLAAPAVLAASCAFMLPVATPPNAIVFGSGHVTIPQMIRAGFLLNIIGMIVITLVVMVFMPFLLAAQ